ncbi:hypothetical protein WR25_12889 [Diploscapter pachys]|uniref:Cyclin N-terminal domain-containing protein n=1 Tax=Diploscapter pachys TaxID=2018661 RepID=A0A2A2LUV9_9BILA|nr:hypothetical protein WR25_12889 [Diploscapter pachys]
MNPQFNYPPAFLNESLWPDWIYTLGKQNADRISSCVDTAGQCDFLSAKTVRYIFTVCMRLRLPNDVRYIAVQIFQKYMSRQLRHLVRFFDNLEENKAAESVDALLAEWEKVETNMSRQLPLRILSVIQIASKVSSFHDSLSTVETAAALRALGHAYTQKAMLKSEIRILKIISYQIPDSPLSYIEAVISIFYTPRTIENIESLYHHCLLYLDIFLLNQREVIISLYRKVTFNDTLMSQEQIRVETEKYIERTRNNFYLVASGVVSAAAQTIFSDEIAEWACSQIVSRIAISRADMANFADALLSVVLRKMADKDRRLQQMQQRRTEVDKSSGKEDGSERNKYAEHDEGQPYAKRRREK